MSYLCPHQCDGKTEYGYCRYTWCVNPLHSNLGTAYQGQGVQMAIITNADKLRAMTDEELAEAFATACPEDTTVNRCCQYFAKGSRGCHDCWLDWLKQEASE